MSPESTSKAVSPLAARSAKRLLIPKNAIERYSASAP